MSITLIRPLIDMDTRLRDIPPEWLLHIEPKLVRGPFLPCWLWAGIISGDGKPMLKDPAAKKFIRAARYAMRMFYDFPEHFYIGRTDDCLYVNCMNPNHMVVQEWHPTKGRRRM